MTSRLAVGTPSRGVAQPGRALGSGPRGRWFKSTRPDQFFKIPRKSAEFSLAVHSGFVRKSGCENRVLRTSNGGLLRNCSTLGYDRRFSGSNLYAHLMLIARIRQGYMIDGVRKFRGNRPAFNGMVEIGRRTTASRSSRICERRARLRTFHLGHRAMQKACAGHAWMPSGHCGVARRAPHRAGGTP